MPFNFQAYDAECAEMSVEQLQRQWNHYTRQVSGSATSTTVSTLALPFTLGLSSIGIAFSAPCVHNARKKREIIERHLRLHNTTHVTRKRDVLSSVALSGTIGGITLGVSPIGAEAVTAAAFEHGFTTVAANEMAVKATVHFAADSVALGAEELHMDHQKAVAERRAAAMSQPIKC